MGKPRCRVLSGGKRTWIDLNRARWRAAMSWYNASTASVLDISRYSLYMLCVPERESYRIQMPKFLTWRGRFSWICKSRMFCEPSFSRLSFPRNFQTRVPYLVDANDLTGGLLDLLQTPHEVPVTRLGNDFVGCEDAHAVHPRIRGGLGGQMAPDDLVFVKTTYEQHISKTRSRS